MRPASNSTTRFSKPNGDWVKPAACEHSVASIEAIRSPALDLSTVERILADRRRIRYVNFLNGKRDTLCTKMTQPDELACIWDYFKPRHTHAWNMLVLAFQELEGRKFQAETIEADSLPGFQVEYAWENVIIRLWLYRTVVRTLTKLPPVATDAELILKSFDQAFNQSGINALKALRDMIEHFDDYAAGKGRGAASRERDLDPWRSITIDEYQRGHFNLSRQHALEIADRLRADARCISDKFIAWYRAQ